MKNLLVVYVIALSFLYWYWSSRQGLSASCLVC